MQKENLFYFYILIVTFLLSIFFTWLNFPGHISWDSSIQLYEAKVSRSIDMHPPLMSMMLKILGGGLIASTAFIFINYFSYFYLILLLLKKVRLSRFKIINILLVVFLIFNPVVMHYSAIVWKDVLQSTFILFTIFFFVNNEKDIYHPTIKNLICLAFLLSLTALTKISGIVIFLAYFLFFAIRLRKEIRFRILTLFTILFFIFVVSINQITKIEISPNEDKLASTAAPNFVLGYDIVGAIVFSNIKSSSFPLSYNEVEYRELLKNYSTESASLLLSDTIYNRLAQMDLKSHIKIWSFYFFNYTSSYLHHKFSVFKNFIFPDDRLSCIPLYVGVSGSNQYLNELNIHDDNLERNKQIFKFYKFFLKTPLFYHISYFLICLSCFAYTYKNRNNSSASMSRFDINLVILMQIILTFIFYFFISLGCDFRYLYSCIGLSLISIINSFSNYKNTKK